jgi:MoaA/NifB/PqqE/SkfB family radical SAM enzyme
MGVKNIRDRLIETINIVKSFELPFTIGMTPIKLNFNDTDNLLELLLKLGAKSFNLSEFVPIERGKNSIDLDLDPEQYKILKYWIKKKESYKLKGFISHHPHYAISIRPDLWFNELYTGCTAGIYDLGIRSNGDITVGT